jgi:hypothetical protein
MEHTEGYCECGYFHRVGYKTTRPQSVGDLIATYAVKPIEHDPITGKPVRNTAGISPNAIQELLFTEGQEVWSRLEESEKTIFANFVRERYLQARVSKGQTVAQRFYGNLLININLGQPIMHGEYNQ